MTPSELASIHASAFAPERGWRPDEFADLLASPYVHLFSRPGGFALVRALAGEAELLTLAVVPERRRQGIATALMTDWMNATEATIAFLEVAEDNGVARALYASHGFAEISRRRGYYSRPDAASVDALLMQAALPPRQKAHLPSLAPKTG